MNQSPNHRFSHLLSELHFDESSTDINTFSTQSFSDNDSILSSKDMLYQEISVVSSAVEKIQSLFNSVYSSANRSEDMSINNQKLDEINHALQTLTTQVAVIKERMDQKFEANTKQAEISEKNITLLTNEKFESTRTHISSVETNLKSSIDGIKDSMKDNVVSRRYKITTAVALYASLIVSISAFVAVINLLAKIP